MKLSEFFTRVKVHYDLEHTVREDPEVVVQIKLPYSTMGGQPTVPVKSLQMGFDWDHGKFILIPEENLTPSDRDFAEQMRKMQDDSGWVKLENHKLKQEIKNLKKQLKAQNE